ncbi:phospholipase A1-like [Leguminivora glycinivorella]|uniref:phospholipase A1-like n=1 Tax=Leguminivora glycinivorella TaxID=1035111 RepID=UPI00200D4F16|nr:phospholipase A1-like [Leguminivora glycinivorella]XP_047994734.1 phospholipase A1-like [Leguminivora glycinivorella]XP_047994735.1 phospholipase A1-like [Leguminivora glycinivorella]XP_047994736.1 phospholipase A1-like [Leguminivora glycinivorella]XP_047994737.1 phospholipase A1-like [Leguminivora glycinivorella]XP_047994738.1 phospholipase A1-like [Leguminivora glycinivorella]
MKCDELNSIVASLVLMLGLVKGDILNNIGSLLPPFLTENFEELVKTADATCKVLPVDVLFHRPFTFEAPLIDFVEFTRDSNRTYRVSEAPRIFMKERPTSLVLYVPGWWNTPTDESSITLVNALLKKIPMVLVLDTRLSFCRGYVDSASRIQPLARLLYTFIKSINKKGYKLENVHLIGFSLGAHVVGVTGKLVQQGMNKNLSRITALDPAKPCIIQEFRLAKSDAKFVQVFHTSAGVLGLEDPVGDLDVYVNGVDIKQPECQNRKISLECDHAQAWKLFAASVLDEKSFRGQRCADWTDLMKGECKGSEKLIGYGCSSRTKGMFLYKTEEHVAQKREGVEKEMKVFNPVELLTSWLGR